MNEEGTMDTLNRLAGYANWANRVWLEYVFERAADDEYLTAMISHIYLAEKVWFQRVDGETPDKDVFLTLSHDELKEIATSCEARYAELIASDLSRIIPYRRLNGEAQESELGDILDHLITHASHHRGQMATYASRNNLDPPETSYITYTRTQAPTG